MDDENEIEMNFDILHSQHTVWEMESNTMYDTFYVFFFVSIVNAVRL